MATIIRIGDEYVNLDNVMSISIMDREVCLHRIDGGPYYITCYNGYKVREILDALADRTKKECEEIEPINPQGTCEKYEPKIEEEE